MTFLAEAFLAALTGWAVSEWLWKMTHKKHA